MVSGEPSNSLPGPPHNPLSWGRVTEGLPKPFPGRRIPPGHPGLGLGALTAAGEEEEVPGEEAGGAAEGPPVQHIHHMAHGVPGRGECLEAQAAHAHLLPVRKRAAPGTGVHHQATPPLCTTSKHPPPHATLPWCAGATSARSLPVMGAMWHLGDGLVGGWSRQVGDEAPLSNVQGCWGGTRGAGLTW